MFDATVAGAPIADIKDWMGHSDISMTMRYAHKSDDGALYAAAKKKDQMRNM